MSALLTIAIPTFNRAEQLGQLLDSLFSQMDAFRDEIRILVVDNHSTDDTALRCGAWKQKGKPFEYICNATNIGMAHNIIKCFELTETPYCWVFGDDDMVRIGALGLILSHLIEQRPDILYCGYTAFKDSPSEKLASYAGPLSLWAMKAEDFCRVVQINMTFISAVITSKQAFLANGGASLIRQHANTLLPQLAWVFECMTYGCKFSYSRQPLVLARLEGSGGFNIFKTFTTDLVQIIDRALPSHLGAPLKRRTLIKFIPALICTVRQGQRGNFEVPTQCESDFRAAFGQHWTYWLVVEPILRLPIPFTKPFFYVSRLIANYLSVYDRALYFCNRLSSAKHRA